MERPRNVFRPPDAPVGCRIPSGNGLFCRVAWNVSPLSTLGTIEVVWL